MLFDGGMNRWLVECRISGREARLSVGVDIDLYQGGMEGTNRCSVVSIYEDIGGRDTLLRLCNALSWKFKNDLEFRINWWRFKFLADPEIGMEAAHCAARADLILLAPKSPTLPGYVQGWFDGWLTTRTPDSGALVLVKPSSKEKTSSIGLGAYLRQTAKRGRLDYLSLESPEASKGFLASQTELSDLISNGGHVDWGINE
jgi:hypothetical protein